MSRVKPGDINERIEQSEQVRELVDFFDLPEELAEPIRRIASDISTRALITSAMEGEVHDGYKYADQKLLSGPDSSRYISGRYFSLPNPDQPQVRTGALFVKKGLKVNKSLVIELISILVISSYWYLPVNLTNIKLLEVVMNVISYLVMLGGLPQSAFNIIPNLKRQFPNLNKISVDTTSFAEFLNMHLKGEGLNVDFKDFQDVLGKMTRMTDGDFLTFVRDVLLPAFEIAAGCFHTYKQEEIWKRLVDLNRKVDELKKLSRKSVDIGVHSNHFKGKVLPDIVNDLQDLLKTIDALYDDIDKIRSKTYELISRTKLEGDDDSLDLALLDESGNLRNEIMDLRDAINALCLKGSLAKLRELT